MPCLDLVLKEMSRTFTLMQTCFRNAFHIHLWASLLVSLKCIQWDLLCACRLWILACNPHTRRAMWVVFLIKLCYKVLIKHCFTLEKYLIKHEWLSLVLYHVLYFFYDILGKSLVLGDYNATSTLVLKVLSARGL